MFYNYKKSLDSIEFISDYAIIAGNLNTFRIKIKFGKKMTTGEGFMMAVPVGWTYPQNDNPLEAGYTTIHAPGGIDFDFTAPLAKNWLRFFKFMIKEGSLNIEDTLEIIYGDRSEGGPGAEVGHVVHKNVPFVYTRTLNNEDNIIVEDCSPMIDILPNKATNLTIRAKTGQVMGKGFDLYCGFEDDYGNRVDHLKDSFDLLNKGVEILDKYQKIVQKKYKIKINSTGFHHLTLYSKDLKRTFMANPVEVTNKESDYKLYFGEIHAHNEHSDAVGTLDELYQYGRDVAHLDFCAASNHDVGHNKNALSWNYHNITIEKWLETVDKAIQYNEPGKFVTFSGLELSYNKDGHTNIYFKEDNEEIYDELLDYLNPDGKWPVKGIRISVKDIAKIMKGYDYLLIPHHPGINFSGYDVTLESRKGGGYINWSNIDEDISPVVEVYSKHGNSVRSNSIRPLRGQTFGCFMEDVLKTGKKYGFIGGSDTHYGNPGSRQEYGPYATLQYPTGLAAVYARELTRDGLFEALRARRCYATTFARIILKFYINGHFMGEEFTLKEDEVPSITVNAAGEGRIKKVDIYKNGELLYTESPVSMRQDINIEYEDHSKLNKHNYYYVSIIEAEGDMAWSSPIYITTQHSQ